MHLHITTVITGTEEMHWEVLPPSRVVGSQSWSGHTVVMRKKFCHCPCQELNPFHAAHSLICILTKRNLFQIYLHILWVF